MNWEDLKIVLAVGRGRTLAAAGRLLAVDPTTVGRRILAIEAQLGARLFDRTGEGYLPTLAGRIALVHAEAIEHQTLALGRQIDGSDARVAGPVRLTGLDLLFDRFLIPRLPVLMARHPALEITFVSGGRLFDLSRREADIAIRSQAPTHPDAVGRKLGVMATAAYCAADRDFGPCPPLIGVAEGEAAHWFRRLADRVFPGSPVVAHASTEGHGLALALAGLGVVVIDCQAGDREPGLRRALPDPVTQDTIWAVTHVEMHRTPRVQAVLDFLTSSFAAEMDLLAGLRPQGGAIATGDR